MSRSNSFTRNEFLHPKSSLPERMTMSDFSSEDGQLIRKEFIEIGYFFRKTSLWFISRNNSSKIKVFNSFFRFSSFSLSCGGVVYHRMPVFIYAIHVFHPSVPNVVQQLFDRLIYPKIPHPIERVLPVIRSNPVIRHFTINVYSISTMVYPIKIIFPILSCKSSTCHSLRTSPILEH